MTQKDPMEVKKVIVNPETGELDLTGAEVLINFKDGTASTKNPTTDAEAGWINVNIDGTTKYIPYYDAS